MPSERRARGRIVAPAAVGRAGAALVASSAVALLPACNGTTSYLDATGATGRHAGTLGWWLTGVSCVVVLFVSAAVVAGIWRHRGERNAPEAFAEGARHAREQKQRGSGTRDAGPVGEGAATRRRGVKHGLRWIYIGTAVTVAILIATFAGTMLALGAASRAPRAPSLTMEVVGHQWWWEVRYREEGRPDLGFVTANEVHLPVGRPVRVTLRSQDVIHSFWLPQIAGKMDLVPGQVNETWVQAERAGRSRGTCGEYCGLQHAVMALAISAEPEADFERWATAMRAAAAPPTGADALAGQAIFLQACGACHSVTGTDARGRVGPDLSHVASRATIGAGALENTPSNLARWILDAPGIKEGARMPAVPLDESQLAAVVAYLQTLR